MEKLIKKEGINKNLSVNDLILIKEISSGGTSLIKILKDNQGNLFINKQLNDKKVYYNKIIGVSVDYNKNFNNEITALNKLGKYYHFPSLINYNKNVNYEILTTYCGVTPNTELVLDNWKEQLLNIYLILEFEAIYHNDFGTKNNLCVLDETLNIIDFGESSSSIEYPYFNLSLNILNKSDTIEEMFFNIRKIGLSVIACLYIRNKHKIDIVS